MSEVIVLSDRMSTYLGTIIGSMSAFAAILGCLWFIVMVIANWKIFTKAGKAGWLSIIPIVSDWNIFDLSWSRTMAWVYLAVTIGSSFFRSSNGEQRSGLLVTISAVCVIVLLIMMIIRDYKLAKAFGKGFGFFLGLVFLKPIFTLILGFGDAVYQGRQQ